MEVFPELIEYLDQKFISIDRRFEAMEERFIESQRGLDVYAKRADEYFQEMKLLTRQVDRHDRWIHRLADATKTKLDH